MFGTTYYYTVAAVTAGGTTNQSAETMFSPAASCSDQVKDGSETDVDCGGGSCGACADGKQCNLNMDCLNGHCVVGASTSTCQPPSCTDNIQDGTETGVDCGGTCPQCETAPTSAPSDGSEQVTVPNGAPGMIAQPVSNDIFVAKLADSGSLAYFTYIGGPDNDSGTGVAVSGQGLPVLVGSTDGNDFPDNDDNAGRKHAPRSVGRRCPSTE